MDPMTLAAIGGTVANVGASLLGEWWAGADEKQKHALEEEAARLYGDISPPTLERVLAEKVGPSAMEGISVDPRLKAARNLALERIMEAGLSGGMDAQGQLALEEGRRAAALQEQQGRAAVRSEARRRGLGGAGEVVGQLAAQQAGANRASLSGLQSGADARSRALQSLSLGMQGGAAASSQDFGEAAQVAQARDRIAAFNAQMAQEANRYNAGLGQQEYENQMALADRRYGAKLRQADTYGQRAQRKRGMAGGVGQSLGYLGGAVGQYGGGK